MALGSTQPLTELSTRDVSWWVRQLMCVTNNLTTIMCRLSRNFVSLNLLQPEGPVQACTGIALLFLLPGFYRDEKRHFSKVLGQ